MALEFSCPHCQKHLSLNALPGDMVACPHCRKKVKVPADAGDQPTKPAQSPLLPRSDKSATDESATDKLKSEQTDALMGLMSRIVPWVISGFVHIVLALVMMFIVMIAIESRVPETMVVPDAFLTGNPGGTMNPGDSGAQLETRQEVTVEQMHHSREESAIPADSGQTDSRVELVAVGNESAAGGAMATLGLDTTGGAAGPRSSFFGTGGNAHHIVFLLDYSGSMSMIFPDVRQEMLVSISRLQPPQDYHIILFYGWGDYIENPPKELVAADYANKEQTGEFFQDLQAPQGSGKGGASDVVPAFERAFDVLAKADTELTGKLIYLLTDGYFTDQERILATIRRRNAGKEVLINTYLFAYKDPHAVKILSQIAGENGGRYKYVSLDE